MITLPTTPAPNGIELSLLDYGAILRPPGGGAVQRVNRKGSRWRASVSLPPMLPAEARIFISRLARAKFEGVRLELPLLVDQGAPGAPVVNGAGQAGTTINLRGMTNGYVVAEGYWLSIVNAAGQHFLHCVTASVTVAGGLAAVGIVPELRTSFADGATVHLVAPQIEGFVDGEEWSWAIPLDRFVRIEFPIEEAA